MRITSVVASFCQVMVEKTGADFNECFDEQMDRVVAKVQAQSTPPQTPQEGKLP